MLPNKTFKIISTFRCILLQSIMIRTKYKKPMDILYYVPLRIN